MVTIRRKGATVIVNEEAPAIAHIMNGLRVVAGRGDLELPRELVITAGRDGKHMAGSKHYTDQAIDLRSKSFAGDAAKERFRRLLESILGPAFRVLLESEGTGNEHFHVQVRKGRQYPTPSQSG